MKDQLNPAPEPSKVNPNAAPRLPGGMAALLKEAMKDKLAKMNEMWTTDPNNPMLKTAMGNISEGCKPLFAKDIVMNHKGMAIVLGPYAKPFLRTGVELISFPNYGLIADTEIAILDNETNPEDPDLVVPIIVAPSAILMKVHESVLFQVPEKARLLREVEKVYNARYKFVPKMQVRWKKYLERRKMRGTFTYIGKLSKKIPVVGEREDVDKIEPEIIDCTILCTLNGCPTTFAVDSRYLEPAEG